MDRRDFIKRTALGIAALAASRAMANPVVKGLHNIADEDTQLEVRTEKKEADISVVEYIANYRNAESFIVYCRQCDNYGRRYGCPPFNYDVMKFIGQYRKLKILGFKIIPRTQLPLAKANDVIAAALPEMNRQLFEAEKVLDGFACGFVGKCIYCSETCARIEGKPCRHPDKVRPSLEAFGFDLMKTSEELLGIKMKWGHDGMMPEYLTLVCGVFYDKKTE